MVVDFLELKTETDPEVECTSGSARIIDAKIFKVYGFSAEFQLE
jgi:hypothetical protein